MIPVAYLIETLGKTCVNPVVRIKSLSADPNWEPKHRGSAGQPKHICRPVPAAMPPGEHALHQRAQENRMRGEGAEVGSLRLGVKFEN